MAKVLVVYDSQTGNTEKMAFAVAEGVKQIEGVSVTTKKANQATLQDLLDADGIIMGSPTYFGQMSAKLKGLIDKSIEIHERLEGKVGAAFTSAGGTATGAETTLLSILEAMLIHGMIVQGRSYDKHYGAAALESPDDEELKFCIGLGKRTASLVLKLKK